MAKCTHGNLGDAEITSLRPDGVHELDPCEYELAEIHENVTVYVHVCNKCGHVDISWSRTPDTKSTICNEELSNKIAEEAPVIHKALCGMDPLIDTSAERAVSDEEWKAWLRKQYPYAVSPDRPRFPPIMKDKLKRDILEATYNLEKEIVRAFAEAVSDVCVTYGMPIKDIVESVQPAYRDPLIRAYSEKIKQEKEKEEANESENN